MAISKVQAVINGTTCTLTYNSTSGKWEGTATAPTKSSYNQSGGYYGVSVTAQDSYGNSKTVNQNDSSLGSSLRLTVKEKVAPVITITSPSASAYIVNNKPTIKWTITDDDSGVNTDTISITVDGNTAITSGITKTAATGGYTCEYTLTTALTDGSHTIKINASDNDGNAATQKSVTFTVDTVPPTLNVSAPSDGLQVNTTAGTITGTTNDVTSSPVTVQIKLNGADQGAITVDSSGAFSKALTYAEGTNTIVVTATDSAGKSSSITRTVYVKTVAPVFTSIELVPNPVDAGATYVIKVKVDEGTKS